MKNCNWCGKKCFKSYEHKGKYYHDKCFDEVERLEAFDAARKQEEALAKEHEYIKPAEAIRQHHTPSNMNFIEDTSGEWRQRSKDSVSRILAKGSSRR